MKSLCVVTLTDVPYQMTVGGAFVYVVKTCERRRVKDFEQRLRVYNVVRYNAVRYNAVGYNAFFPCGPRRPRYNGVAVYNAVRYSVFSPWTPTTVL